MGGTTQRNPGAALAARGGGSGIGTPARGYHTILSPLQSLWAEGHHLSHQLQQPQCPGPQHQPSLARLREPWRPAAALLHRGHPAEAQASGSPPPGEQLLASPAFPLPIPCPFSPHLPQGSRCSVLQ